MNTMKMITLIFVMMISCIITYGQNSAVNAAYNLSIAAENANATKRGTYIEGTPYKNENFINAIFYQKVRPSLTSATRLNYFLSNFEFMIDDKIYLIDPSSIDSIRIKDQLYLFKTFKYNGKSSTRIVELTGKSEKSLLYKFTPAEFKPEVKAGSYRDPKPASYVWDEPVFLIETGDNIIELTNWTKLINCFPEKGKYIKAFIKSNKIKKDDPADLLKLIQYIDKQI
jgi:hypothetical protein